MIARARASSSTSRCSTAAWQASPHFAENYLVSGEVPQRRGNGGFGGIPSQAFECADGKLIFIVATTNPQFSRACEAFGQPLMEDPRFNSIAARIEHRLELLEILEKIFLERPREHWLVELEARDVPVGPVNNIEETLADEQVRFRELQMSMHDEALDDVRYPIRMSATPVTEYAFPPRLGEDSASVSRELLGLTADEIQDLTEAGLI